ncbi:hypothetical protein MiAbW_03189 [Microcystis aeruginosa NIES-4325]|uniref:PEP-CTERM protein-sorting domain-containing protein n=1 Tax=Microcystis aeruginosa NIES-4325 TaxID=2569534 RepID=A0A5J4FC68_MICAE|nr:hypothetical protein [Microcystis aeruginosa]GEA28613.1 hypothetical protein MiAbW_03189 [Microcystis aeruginosa NIES-4325]
MNNGRSKKHGLLKALLKSFSLVTATALGCISIATSATATSLSFSSTFGAAGSGNGEFNSPSGIDGGSGGNIYVADTFNDRVQPSDSSDVFQSTFSNPGSGYGQFSGVFQSAFGSSDSVDVQFNRPRDIAVDSGDNISVADTFDDRLQAFSPSQPPVSTPELFGLIGLGILGSGLVVRSVAKRR